MVFPSINLLPVRRVRTVRRNYFLRLATTAIVLLSIAVGLHSLFLVPSYVFLKEEISNKKAHIQGLVSIRTPEQQELMNQVAVFEHNASRLQTLATTLSGSDILRSVLGVSREEIRLSGFTFTPEQDKPAFKLSITGTAETREALRRYHTKLSELPFVTGADLPIGAYAKETAIPFTLTITGTRP